MKKIFTIVLLVFGFGVFSAYYSNISLYIGMGADQVTWYLCQWALVLFILNVFSLTLEKDKYSNWAVISIVVSIISLFFAYKIGDGNGAIVSINGELVNWFFAGLYSFISIIYFIVQYSRGRRIN